MRAKEVIATHANTDFDAFAAMLAARHLYPGAVVAVGALNRNVRDFYRQHGEELGAVVESARLEQDAIRRLIVVETTNASRLGELESVALDPSVEKVLFDHRREAELPDWIDPDVVVLTDDGALTTTLVGIIAERGLLPSPLEATAFALGIHEETGSLTYATSTQRDADALAWCLRHGARQDLVAEHSKLDDARALAVAAPEQADREPRRARDVMSTPPRSVEPDEKVRDAMVLCQRHGQSGVFVVEGGRVVGAVSRENLDKAVGHGLARAPVRGIMSGRVVTAEEDAALPELQALVTDAEDGRVAVVRDDELVGVVTRADLLRALEGIELGRDHSGETLADELTALEPLRVLFDAVATIGDRAGAVYLVGGTVRDILLGEESFDVDIAVEGDAIEFARALAATLQGRVTPHRKFGTAVVSYGGDERVDVVTTRTEFYDAPGALPTVERAGLREDLFRRDFTINAMAVSLEPAGFGRLVDPFGGRADLAARLLRVLHNLSFIDDPTRIFRAIRYEARYGLRLEEHSARLARACIEMGLVGDVSSARLRDELQTLLEEDPGAVGGVLRLGELAADHAIHPRLRADKEAAEVFERALKLRDELRAGVPAWRIGLAVLGRDMTSEEAYSWLDRLKVRRRDVDRIAGAITVAPRIAERIRTEELDPAEIVALADPFAPDAPLLALALEDVPALRAYFTRLRDVRIEIGGSELATLGLSESPRVGEVLAELRRRKLNGELDGRDSELEAARKLIAAGSDA